MICISYLLTWHLEFIFLSSQVLTFIIIHVSVLAKANTYEVNRINTHIHDAWNMFHVFQSKLSIKCSPNGTISFDASI